MVPQSRAGRASTKGAAHFCSVGLTRRASALSLWACLSHALPGVLGLGMGGGCGVGVGLGFGAGVAYGSQQIDAQPKWGAGPLGSATLAAASAAAARGAGATPSFPLFGAVRAVAERAGRCRRRAGDLERSMQQASRR